MDFRTVLHYVARGYLIVSGAGATVLIALGSQHLPALLRGVVVGLVVLALFAQLMHDRRLCATCLNGVPVLDPQSAVQAKDRQLRMYHWTRAKRVRVLLTAAAVAAVIEACGWLATGDPFWTPAIVVELMLMSTVTLVAGTWPALVHGQLEPWCPYCRRGRDDDDDEFPKVPDPPDPGREHEKV